MSSTVRIARTLMFRSRDRQAGVRSEWGFTLIEMMVAVGIMAILMAIAVNSYGNMKRANDVEGASSGIRSALAAARLQARSTGRTQYVTIDYANERFATTVWGGTFSAVTNLVTGGERTVGQGVNIIASSSNNGLCGSNNIATMTNADRPADLFQTFSFSGRGTATKVIGGTTTWTLRTAGANVEDGSFCISVRNVTGEVVYFRLN